MASQINAKSRENLKSMFSAALFEQRHVSIIRYSQRNDTTFCIDDHDVKGPAVLHFQNCGFSKIMVTASSVLKVLIEKCNYCTFTIACKLRNETVEVWNSEGCSLRITGGRLSTVQLDKCSKSVITF